VIERGAAVVSTASGDLELRRTPLDGGGASALLPGAVLMALGGQLGPIAMGSDGTLALGLDDRVVRWRRGDPAPVELGRHRSAVAALAISDDGGVASGAEDGSVTRWTAAGPRSLSGHVHPITALGFGQGGRLASGDTSGDVRVWTPGGSELLRGHDRRIESLAFGPGETLYTAGGDASVRAWPVRPAPAAFATGTGSAFRLAFVSPVTIAASNEDGRVELVSLATGTHREIARFTRQAYGIQRLSGGRFAAASWDGGIAVFGPAGEVLRRFDHGAEINALAASPDGTRLATTAVDGTVRLWSVETGDEGRPDRRADRLVERRTGAAIDAAFSPDGRTLVTSGDDLALHVIDLVAGGAPRSLLGHTDAARALTFSRDGRTLYSAGGDGVVRAWDLATGASRAYAGHDGRVRTLALSSDQRYLASGGADGLVVVWDLVHGGRATALRGHAAEVRWVAFSPRGARLASAGWDGTARLWDLADGSARVWHADDDKVQCVEFSPDGAQLASAGADGAVRLWSVDDDRTIPGGYAPVMTRLSALTTAAIDGAAGADRLPAVTTPP
jgi:WD40 repeat protein